jgi:hypothetical protein
MTAIHGCTVATGHYRAQALVLAESFLAHHPGGRFTVLFVGAARSEFPDDGSIEVLLPGDLDLGERELHRRATMYNTQGLAGSLKPELLAHLLAREGSPVLFLDADGRIFGDLTEVAEQARCDQLLLSPHSLDPYPLHGIDPTDSLWREDGPEQIILRAGVMNAGLIGVAPGAEEFLRWWRARTRRRSLFDLSRGLVYCQGWLTLAPALFEHSLLRDRGCNVAGWNLQARDVEWAGDEPRIDGGVLRHFHFAGSFDPESPEQITPVANLASWWPPLSERPGAARIVREYAEALLAAGYHDCREDPPIYDHAPGGTTIEPWMRAGYRVALHDAEAGTGEEPPNPFDDGSERFFSWLAERAAEAVQRQDDPPDSAAGLPVPADSEMTAALLDRTALLARIAELEGARDDAAEWARVAGGEAERAMLAIALREAERDEVLGKLAAREQEIDEMRTMMESVWSSLSWRATEPLRTVGSMLPRARGRRSPPQDG